MSNKNAIEPFNLSGKFWGCFREDISEPYCTWMFKSDADNWASKQPVTYEVKAINISF
ncbi:hypothetical protein [Terribacillus saccharophilus]|uniref:hypothetical protein n=1 Tax=Terribacillus saccharophilus TaxID=361277 RepID=UPI002989E039|nr:hypothetical protein [Terribacillus saccharophilus]MCM3227519.1 hypothetical protein [Terribacillus saccharophilus]